MQLNFENLNLEKKMSGSTTCLIKKYKLHFRKNVKINKKLQLKVQNKKWEIIKFKIK